VLKEDTLVVIMARTLSNGELNQPKIYAKRMRVIYKLILVDLGFYYYYIKCEKIS